MRRLPGEIAQRAEMRLRHLPQIEIRGGDVAEDEALDPEPVIAVLLDHEARAFERRQQTKRRGARNAGARGERGQRQSAIVE